MPEQDSNVAMIREKRSENDLRGSMTKQKTAIVTAAGRGMGAACARALAEKGYAVSLMSVSERSIALAQELGGIGWQGSVTESVDLQRLVDGTIAEYGRIDAVVNNTGHPPKGNC